MKQPLKTLQRVSDQTLVIMFINLSGKKDKKQNYNHLKMLIKSEGQKRQLEYFLT